MDRSRHTITKYLNEERIHIAINEPFFKSLKTVENVLYEVKLLKSTNEHREHIIVGFSILHYAKLRTLELYYNFFDKFCDLNKFEELEMDTGSLYLALAEKNLLCLYPSRKNVFGKKSSKMTADIFSRQMQNLISSLKRVAVSRKSMISGSQDCSKRI